MTNVVGIGMSSSATVDEVADLVAALLDGAGLCLADIDTIATRRQFVTDGRLALGPRVVGYDDDALIAASTPVDRGVGIPARVAETAAALAAGTGPNLGINVARSPHVTAALVSRPASGGVEP